MTILTTTLAQLRKHHPCVGGYNKLVRALQGKPFTSEDEDRETHIRFQHEAEIPLEFILDSNGLDDALWALRASNCSERDARLLAVAFARDVEHLMPEASRPTLDVAERFANGQATPDELAKASFVAYSAAYADTSAAVYSASAYSAAYAAYQSAYRTDASASAYRAYAYASAAVATTYDEEARQRQTELFRQLCQGTTPWHTQP